MTRVSSSAAPPVRLPDAPAVVAGVSGAVWLGPTGEAETLTHGEAARRIYAGATPIVCHAKAVSRRLAAAPFLAYDLLELFAFVRPARFCLPTVRGLCAALLVTPPGNAEEEAQALLATATALLAELRASPRADALPIAWAMSRAGWPWGAAVLGAIAAGDSPPPRDLAPGLRVWGRLREWQELPPPPAPGSWPVEAVEARARLVQLLGAGAEPRPQQMQYASHAAAAFAPRERAGAPRVVIAEAGTGVGKTLAYLAPASVWAEKNRAPVWISTYTRNLQRQLDQELDRLYPEISEKRRRVVIRKGRENLFCLLNFEEATNRLPPRPPPGGDRATIALGLVARWVTASRDGDMVGGDFPGWLADLLGRPLTGELTDTRGECIYGACRHYRKCFIERSVRRARRAQIVVANHALVMVQTALGGDDHELPTRYVFDEGHHLFDAADSAFSAHLTGRESADLRRWLLGAEQRARSRRRGLKERIGDLLSGDDAASETLDAVLRAARALPAAGWRTRLSGGTPIGPAETFLAVVRRQVLARDAGSGSSYSLECALHPPSEGLLDASRALGDALARLAEPLQALIRALYALLDREATELDTAARQRAEALARSIDRRAMQSLQAWRAMLASIETPPPAAFVDWLGIERAGGGEVDVGLHRHWLDPMQPFAEVMSGAVHGMLITSASLRDGTGDDEADWATAEQRTGVRYLAAPPVLSVVPSPFDYAGQTRVFVVTDVNRDDSQQVAAAYRELFLAAGGGALGLFTAISRLRAVHQRITAPLDAAGLSLLAQHVDALDTSTLIDIFRAEEDTSLLGTDAVRDGVDVPGRSLRLIVFDRVPWPRPDILHKARREAFGGRRYDEMLTRLKLKQAYGRLIRSAGDRGVFVMLDRALPSRLNGAFPAEAAPERVGLAAAIGETRAFLAR